MIILYNNNDLLSKCTQLTCTTDNSNHDTNKYNMVTVMVIMVNMPLVNNN